MDAVAPASADNAMDAAGIAVPIQEWIKVGVFVAFTAGKQCVETIELQLAAVALSAPNKMLGFWRDAPVGEARTLAGTKAFNALPKTWRDTVVQATTLASEGSLLGILEVESVTPLRLRPHHQTQGAMVAWVLCKVGMALPPEAASPWRWDESWAAVVDVGEAIGPDFSTGMHKASAAAAKNVLSLRAVIGGHRPTSLKAVGAMVDVITMLDIRDNMLTGAEAAALGRHLSRAPSLSKLSLAGNPLDADALVGLCTSIGLSSPGHEGSAPPVTSITDLDISRTLLGGDDDAHPAMEVIAQLGSAISFGGSLRSLNVAHSALGTRAGCFIDALGNPLPPLEPGGFPMSK